jgi:hypothetical protein
METQHMAAVDFLIQAGPHNRRDCPMVVSLPVIERTPAPGVRVVGEDGQELPAQVCQAVPGWVAEDAEGCAQVAFLLPLLGAGEALKATAHFGDFPIPERKVSVLADGDGSGGVSILVNGVLVTAYRYLGNPARPCFFPLLGPGGKRVTRSWPIEEGVPDSAQDHPHHRSLWVAHGDVNGCDNWSEAAGHGFQLTTDLLAACGGPVLGVLTAAQDWTDAQRNKLLEEVRTVTAYALPGEERLLDLDVTFTATECDVRFGDTKEGGVLALRVASSMDGDRGGRIENSYGGVGEAECWGRRAQWCDYSGEVGGEMLGIAVFDHPTSFRHPTYWHVRDYGMYTANPFGWHDFYGDPAMDGSHILPRGASLRFHYRIYLHRGNATDAAVAERYHDYANPPAVRLV